MNLKKVEFKDADLEYIKDNGAAKFVEKVFNEVRITDNCWKEYVGPTALFEFVDENGIDFKKFCKYVDSKFPNKTSKWAEKFCDYVDDAPESLDDTIVETVENGPYSWEDAIDILDVLLSDEEKKEAIAGWI